ncbi:MAG: hypothetical protein JXA94_02195, partial [Parachlamydiales bacterium]|nr:hypothetical protein [Parachlamydiales bacterium]
TFLLIYFININKIEKKVEISKKEIFEKNHLHVRLGYIFSEIKPNNLKNAFYLEEEKNKKALFVIFDNKVDPDPNFSGYMQGKIFINDKNDLMLKISSLEDENIKPREEILYKNVKKLEYRFLAISDNKLKTYLKEDVTKNLSWYNFWPEDKKSLPSSICIKVNDADFAFFTFDTNAIITYKING